MLSIKLIMPPAIEPVTLDEAKTWLKLETADEDATLTRLIASARQMVEQYTRRALITQTWRLSLVKPPALPFIILPKAPVQQVVNGFTQSDATTQVPIDLSKLWLDSASEPPRLVLPSSLLMPVTGPIALTLDIQFGYGDQPAKIPEALKQAVLVFVAQAYEQRCAASSLPIDHIAGLIAPFIIRRI